MAMIKVTVDVYENKFNAVNGEISNKHCFDKVRAINPQQQAEVDACITKMRERDDPILWDPDLRLPRNKFPLIQVGKEAVLDTEEQMFHFN
ncbi:hypothetical protein KRX11_07670 [Pasteurellaceae bacterium TAE3-ERU1]|uniref:hypothetical protein n=1 Tax=Spirabiliibacterium mucosae TaxID=28156 RepID=UPI001AADCE48|nr:hypothetical protein [Spirabiliibacterium mucosae]MBE2898749.1 hypothetical protein [Spirabiliibacterium mucosae]MBV7388520.1 hypothetical protein [Pasteurellaceae bacterium TAE3-ERU1]